MKNLMVAEQKGLQDVKVFKLNDEVAVAAYTVEEAKAWYISRHKVSEDELFNDKDILVVSMDEKVRKGEGEEEEGMISVREIVNTYCEGEPFIAISYLH